MQSANHDSNSILPAVVPLFVKYLQRDISLQEMISRFDKIYYEADPTVSQYFLSIMEKISLASDSPKNLADPENQGLLISENDLKKHVVEFLHRSIDDLKC